MTATTGTTIEGVSVLPKNGGRLGDPFAIGLSRRGIEVRRRDRPAQMMSWDRVSPWEIAERDGYVLLILRGGGRATPLVVPGWTLDDLEILMRAVTADSGADDGGVATASPPPEPAAAAPSSNAAARPAPVRSRVERRRRRRVQLTWKPVVTVLLLCALATAVTLVLLQSSGIINWGFLGPVA